MQKKNIIVVLGMHRSGTSLVTRGLQVLGVELGDALLPPQKDNPRGFWEDIDINNLNIEMLEFLDRDWYFVSPIQSSDVEKLNNAGYHLRALDLLRDKMKDKQVFGMKDPRLAKLLPFWQNVFAKNQLDVSYVITIRHPFSVRDSLFKRHNFEAERAHFLWLDHIVASFANTIGMKRVVVDYDRMMNSIEAELSRIARQLDLNIDSEELGKFVNQFLDKKLRHTIYQPRDLLLDDATPMLVKDIYLKGLEVASDEIKIDTLEFESHIESWTKELHRLIPALVFADKLEIQKLTLLGDLAERDAQLVERDAQLAERDAQLAERDAQLAERDAQLHAIQSSKTWKIALLFRKLRVKIIPLGSLREKVSRLMFLTLRVLKNEGFLSVVRKIKHRLWGKDSKPFFDYQQWILNNEPNEDELANQRVKAKGFAYKPLISILIPVWNTPPDILTETIQSVLSQTYGNWELCIADGQSDDETIAVLKQFLKSDSRIKCKFLSENQGISASTNVALDISTGDYIFLLDHDDLLPSFTLYEFANYINENLNVEMIYGDEDKINMSGVRHTPFFKPAWDPYLLYSFMYVGHSLYKRDLVLSLGGFRSEYDFSQDYDLALRVTEVAKHVGHIPKVLYHWREMPGSAAVGDKDYARESNISALADALQHRGFDADVVALPTHNQVIYNFSSYPLISIIIPSDNIQNIEKSLVRLSKNTSYPNYEILVVTNSQIVESLQEKLDKNLVRFVKFDREYNFSAKCNLGAAQAEGEYVLFLNDDVYPITEDWLEKMLGTLQQSDVGAVSPKMVYSNGRIQHAGLVTGVRNLVGTAFHTYAKDSTEYFNLAQCPRTVSALSAACLLMRQDVFVEVEGYDEINTPIMHSDLDLSFKIRDIGLRLVYMPESELTHVGHLSIKHIESEKTTLLTKVDTYLLKRWAKYVAEDPYFSNSMRDLLYIDSPTKIRMWAKNTPESVTTKPDILIQTHDLSLSGVPIFARDLAFSLKDQGQFVTVIAERTGELRESIVEKQLPVIIDPLILDTPHATEKFLANFDLVVANTILAWRLVLLAKSLHIPVVWIIHESDYGVNLVQENTKIHEALMLADQVIFPSKQTLRKYREFNKKDNFISMLFGVEAPQNITQAHRMEMDQTRKIRIAHIGSVEERKGQDILIKAISLLPSGVKEMIDVSFIGRVLDPGFYQRQLQASAGLSSVQWLGSLPHEQVWEHIYQSDILVCSSRNETGPLVVYEAMALGKAVVSTPVGAVPEVIQHGINGMIFSNEKPNQLTSILETLLLDRALIDKIGVNALQTYEKILQRQTFTAAIQEIIEKYTTNRLFILDR